MGNNSLDTLSKVSGLSKDTMKEIFAEVKVNLKRLDSCIGPHDFNPSGDDAKIVVQQKYKCSKCLGTIDFIAFSWYTKGLKHGSVKK
jgi:hypothetical protein